MRVWLPPLVTALLLVALRVVAVDAQQRYIPGVFAASTQGPVELIAWAERIAAGRLRIAEASLEDVPVLPDFFRAMINMPFWNPVAVLAGTERAFHDDTPELLPLVFGVRKLNSRAVELRVSSVEKPDKAAQLFERLKASAESPGYLFIVIASETRAVRYYPVRIAPRPAP